MKNILPETLVDAYLRLPVDRARSDGLESAVWQAIHAEMGGARGKWLASVLMVLNFPGIRFASIALAFMTGVGFGVLSPFGFGGSADRIRTPATELEVFAAQAPFLLTNLMGVE